MNIDKLELSVRAYNCLKRAGVNTVEDLCNKTSEDMMQVRNLGRICLEEVCKVMEVNGLKFREPEEEPITIKGVITATITDSLLEFESNAESAALSKWGYNKEDVEKCLLELDRYRATRLTPEETVHIKDEANEWRDAYMKMKEQWKHDCDLLAKCGEELSSYRQAEEQGLLIILPCKVGDTVYEITTFFWEDRDKCEKCQYFHEGDCYFRDDDCCTYADEHDTENKDCLCIAEITVSIAWIAMHIDCFGKTVFLTREAAEEALKGGGAE